MARRGRGNSQRVEFGGFSGGAEARAGGLLVGLGTVGFEHHCRTRALSSHLYPRSNASRAALVTDIRRLATFLPLGGKFCVLQSVGAGMATKTTLERGLFRLTDAACDAERSLPAIIEIIFFVFLFFFLEREKENREEEEGKKRRTCASLLCVASTTQLGALLCGATQLSTRCPRPREYILFSGTVTSWESLAPG